jgi:hypothetical protein
MNRNERYGRGWCWSAEDDFSRGAGQGGDPWGGGRGRCRGGRAERPFPRNETEPRAGAAGDYRGASPWEVLQDFEERLSRLEAKLASEG